VLRPAAVCATVTALAAGGARAPNLVIRSLSVSQQGTTLRVADVVANAGRGTAAASTTGYYLGNVRIGRSTVAPIGRGSSVRESVVLTIPARVAPGAYRLKACADATLAIRESDERDNCRLSAVVGVSDRSPPVFSGLTEAVTCIPGPVGGTVRSAPFTLRWTAAADDSTPPRLLVYDVYEAASAGGEDFAAPTYTAKPGATTFTTPALPDDASYYFVVRARDAAGNRDRNAVERRGVNLCL